MKTIALTNGFVALVDDADFDFLMQWKWSVVKGGNTYYAIRNTPWVKIDGKWSHTTIRMHRELLSVTDPTIFIDHRDRNGLNNQRENIRICESISDNNCNKSSSPNARSQYLGVSWHKKSAMWVARISRKGKNHSLGYFNSETDAAEAYKTAARSIHGKFSAV